MLHHIEPLIDIVSLGTSSRESLAQDAGVSIRAARESDAAALRELAEIDSAAPLEGELLVAVVDNAIWAALAVGDGRVVADPFRPSAAAVQLLRLRVEQIGAARCGGRRRALPRWLARRVRT